MSVNFSVVRVEKRTRQNVEKFERHIERKNENYSNMNVDLSQTENNIHFKSCDMTYTEKRGTYRKKLFILILQKKITHQAKPQSSKNHIRIHRDYDKGNG